MKNLEISMRSAVDYILFCEQFELKDLTGKIVRYMVSKWGIMEFNKEDTNIDNLPKHLYERCVHESKIRSRAVLEQEEIELARLIKHKERKERELERQKPKIKVEQQLGEFEGEEVVFVNNNNNKSNNNKNTKKKKGKR